MITVHACARLETRYFWPHLTSKYSSEVSNSTDACSTLCNKKENYIEQQEYSHKCEKALEEWPESTEKLHWVINEKKI